MIASLTQKQSQERAASFTGELNYKFFLCLDKGTTYCGLVQYDFSLSDKKNVFLDFSGKSIDKVTANGKDISSEQITNNWKDGQFQLSPEWLREGENKLEVAFSNLYNTDGNGLHTSQDSDGDQFIYCQNEPYWFNRVVPVFDQPDLKAHATFHFLCPQDWQVISNTSEALRSPSDQLKPETPFDKRVAEVFASRFSPEILYLRFAQTPKLPTYLYAFVAGPYQCIEYDESDGPSPTPLRIFCNKQNLKYVVAQQRDIFLYYIRAIAFYEKFFQTKFQFEKADTVFCPEYTVGAMEYPGVVTYTDRLVWKQEQPTPAQVSLRGGVIVHELAHMWFGNFVTMKWWNDLWLNESFADFARYLCQHMIDKDLPFETTDSWTNMLVRKGWGYLEDKRVTTHPIACEVENTSKADSIFDGITYAKGAAVLKQLYFLIGHEAFSNNLGRYFAKYGWSNATLAQFLEEISREGPSQKNEHPAYDIQAFNKSWIETAGLNEVRVRWDPSVSGKTKLVFEQSCHLESHPTLRFNKLKFACFDSQAHIVHTQEFILENKAETTIEIENNGFKAILPNFEDWGFIKVILDEHSSKFFLENLSKLKDDLSTLLVVRAFYDAIFDGKMRATDFVGTLIKTKFLEKLFGNSTLMDSTLKFLEASLGFVHGSFRDEFYDKAFNEMLRLLALAQLPHDQTMLTEKLVNFCKTVSSIDVLKRLFEGTYGASPKFTLQEKWKIVFKINSSSLYSDTQKRMITEGMKAEDPSDLGKNFLLSIEALTCDEDKIEELWTKQYFCKERTMSYTKIGCSLQGFFNRLSFGYNKHKYIQRYFDELPNLFNNDGKEVGKTVLFHLPCWRNKQFLIDNFKKVLKQIKPERQYFIDSIGKIISDLENLQKIDLLYEN